MWRMIFLFISLLLISLTMNSQSTENKKIPVLNFDQLQPLLHFSNDTVYLINFWATWCAPCIKELPAIMDVEKKYADQKFKVYLVSLDMPNQLENRLIPFLKTNKIESDVILLNDANQNRWINKVDANWSGDIPFTLIYGKDFRESHAKSFDFETLDALIRAKLNLP